MFKWNSIDEWRQLWRYYQAGVVNTIFGYAVFAAFIKLDLNMFAAQALSHIIGATFNYVTYSRYVFAGKGSNLASYVLAYIFNYALSAIALFMMHRALSSPYLCGMIATGVASIINYFALKVVFRWKASDEQEHG
jgi:putative flippase GtrA